MIRFSKLSIFILVTFLYSLKLHAWKRDSLISVTKSNLNDSLRTEAFYFLAMESNSNEEALAIEYFHQAEKLANKQKSNLLIGEAYAHLSYYYLEKRKDYSNALKYMMTCIKYHEKGNFYTSLKFKYNHIARYIFEKLELYDEAIKALKKCAHYAKLEGNGNNAYQLYILGWFESTNGYSDSAIKHLKKAAQLNETYKIEDKGFLIEMYTWIGNTYNSKKENRLALAYQFKALKMADSNKIERAQNDCYRYIAQTYRVLKKNDSAVYFLKKAVNNYIQTKSFIYKYYAGSNLITWQVKDKNIKEAEKYVNILLDSSEYNYKSDEGTRMNFDMALFNFYSSKKNYEKALNYLRDYQIMTDSTEKRKRRSNVGEQNLQLEFQKQQELVKLEQQEKDFKSKEELDKQKNFNYALGGVVLFVIVLLYMASKIIKQKQNAFKEISIQKKEVEVQKKLVESKNKEVLDSIHYARRIQNALLAHKEFINENIPNNFLLFKPKDIVSGDFYWATSVRSSETGVQRATVNNSEPQTPNAELFYLAVCDCTGHGVPGAFMSLLSIGFLSEAINEREIYSPNEVFNYVRERLIKSLGKDEQKDGFDGILLCIDKQNKKITYAAANNAPVLVSNNTLIKLNCNKMPVGQTEIKEDFSLFTIDLKQNDTLYLFTDGYADQFGGNKLNGGGKKFKKKSLHEMLLRVSNEPLDSQKTIIEKTFDDWKGELEQVDDVIITGIKF
jgi:serine phosphatase RsbU (regulator of sigma subunit)